MWTLGTMPCGQPANVQNPVCNLCRIGRLSHLGRPFPIPQDIVLHHSVKKAGLGGPDTVQTLLPPPNMQQAQSSIQELRLLKMKNGSNRSCCRPCARCVIFPGRRQPSIVTVNELNYCVRDGNRCTLVTINTHYLNCTSLCRSFVISYLPPSVNLFW